uniref:Uncharacterized protein n=1 Tax=Amphimedon queenslandica TaxID=400682 RepID=A0A1X7SML5_AMPQE
MRNYLKATIICEY